MSWIENISSAIGVPASSAVLAISIYAACVAAEKEARKARLNEISQLLQNRNWSKDFCPTIFVKMMFDYTFGGKHASTKCLIRSCAASIIVVTTLTLQLYLFSPSLIRGHFIFSLPNTIIVLLIACVADYAALYKSRLVINFAYRNALSLFSIVIFDIILSVLISIFTITVIPATAALIIFPDTFTILGLLKALPEIVSEMLSGAAGVIHHNSPTFGAAGILILSTAITSIWAIVIFVSTLAIKLLLPVQFFTNWFFPVEEHPIRAIGIVAAGLILITSFAWALIRSLFA